MRSTIFWGALWLATGCSGGGDDPKKPNDSGTSAASSAPTTAASAAPGALVDDTPDGLAADEARRLKVFETRPAVRLPPEVPRRWHDLVRDMGARVVAVDHAVRSGEPKALRRIQLELRLFGHDATIDQKAGEALATLGLQAADAPLPEGEQVTAGQRWSVDLGRFKAPDGRAREHRLTLTWGEQTPTPEEMRPCKRPQPVDVPTGTPDWLARATLNQSTRRRVVARAADAPEGLQISLLMLYQNGYAHDGHVDTLTKAAAAAGLTEKSGEGSRQSFSAGNRRLAFAPDNSELSLGCNLAGPVLRLTYTETRAPAP